MGEKVTRRQAVALAGMGVGGLLLDGCGGSGSVSDSNVGSILAPSPMPTPTPALNSISNAPSATVAIQRNKPGTLLDSDFLGFSLEKSHLTTASYLHPSNTALINLFKLLGMGVMRVGAGSVDFTSWRGQAVGLSPITPTSVDALAAFAKATGWKVVYGINFVKNTIANAVDEAVYAAARLGSSLQAFEFGNEVDQYVFSGLRPPTFRYPDFLLEWRALRDAIVLAVPSARFVGPSAVGADLANYPIRFSRDEGSRIVNLSHHYYIANGQNATSTIDRMLLPDPALTTMLNTLVDAAADARISGGLVLNEANSFYNYGSFGVSNSFASSLWVIDFLFTCASAGCRGVYLHNTGVGAGYAPIIVINGVVSEVRPEFYGLAMFAKGARGVALPASVTLHNTTANLTAHGVQRADGGINIMLVNKDADETIMADIDLGAAASGLMPTYLRGSALANPIGQTINDATIGIDGFWKQTTKPTIPVSGTRAAVEIPPHTAILLESC